MFKLSIETSNDAFVDYPGQEIATILAKAAADLMNHSCETNVVGFVRDSNGNKVGSWNYMTD